MIWNSFTLLGLIAILVSTFRIGVSIQLPEEWSSIQVVFDDDNDDIYPKTSHHHAEASAALQGENYGGDIIFTEDAPTPSGAAAKDVGFRWPGYPGKAIIPYFIHPTMRKIQYIMPHEIRQQNGPIKKLIFKAMDQYRRNTCIDFVPRKKQKDYVRFIHGRGCSSFVGRQGGRQDVILGNGCQYVGTIVHEIGHIIGLYHEHQRSNRDKYLEIFIKNVLSGQEHNFDKTPKSEEYLLTPFNYNSIMIYGNYAFSRKPGKWKTMALKNKKVLRDPYDKPGLDNTDIKEVNKLYECETTTESQKKNQKNN